MFKLGEGLFKQYFYTIKEFKGRDYLMKRKSFDKIIKVVIILILIFILSGCQDELVIKETENIEPIEVKYKTSEKEVIKKLPDKIEVVLTDGNNKIKKNVEVTWSSVDDYRSDIPQTYSFKGVFKVEELKGVEYVDVEVEPEQKLDEDQITDFELDVTDSAGELKYKVGAYSKNEIKKVYISTSEETIEKNIDKKNKINVHGIIEADPGTDSEINFEEVEVKVETENGNIFSKKKDHYVRRYDVFEGDKSVEVGVSYWPHLGGKSRDINHKQWENDAVGIPLIGEYEYRNNMKRIVNRHIDQMQSAGISRLTYCYLAAPMGNKIFDNKFKRFKEVDLVQEIKLEIQYDFSHFGNWVKENRIGTIKNDLKFIRDNIFTMKNYNTYNGRPIIIFWNPNMIKEIYNNDDEVNSKWNSLGSFMEFIRSTLTVNEIEPFIIGDFGNLGHRYKNNYHQKENIDFIQYFDAVTTWTGYNRSGEVVSWEEQYEFVIENFEGYEELHNEFGIEFLPRAFPGFDTKNNLHRVDDDRLTPPNPEYFEKMLELVDQYRTLPYINIASWNEWEEGHNIEPGYYHDRSYEDYPVYHQGKFGFDYLDEIKKFHKEK